MLFAQLLAAEVRAWVPSIPCKNQMDHGEQQLSIFFCFLSVVSSSSTYTVPKLDEHQHIHILLVSLVPKSIKVAHYSDFVIEKRIHHVLDLDLPLPLNSASLNLTAEAVATSK
jgi:hypothetical protein